MGCRRSSFDDGKLHGAFCPSVGDEVLVAEFKEAVGPDPRLSESLPFEGNCFV